MTKQPNPSYYNETGFNNLTPKKRYKAVNMGYLQANETNKTLMQATVQTK